MWWQRALPHWRENWELISLLCCPCHCPPYQGLAGRRHKVAAASSSAVPNEHLPPGHQKSALHFAKGTEVQQGCWIFILPQSYSMHKGCRKYFSYISSSLPHLLFHLVENAPYVAQHPNVQSLIFYAVAQFHSVKSATDKHISWDSHVYRGNLKLLNRRNGKNIGEGREEWMGNRTVFDFNSTQLSVLQVWATAWDGVCMEMPPRKRHTVLPMDTIYTWKAVWNISVLLATVIHGRYSSPQHLFSQILHLGFWLECFQTSSTPTEQQHKPWLITPCSAATKEAASTETCLQQHRTHHSQTLPASTQSTTIHSDSFSAVKLSVSD